MSKRKESSPDVETQTIIKKAATQELRRQQKINIPDIAIYDYRELFSWFTKQPDIEEIYKQMRNSKETPQYLVKSLRGHIYEAVASYAYTGKVFLESEGQEIVLPKTATRELIYQLALNKLKSDPTAESALRVVNNKGRYDPDGLRVHLVRNSILAAVECTLADTTHKLPNFKGVKNKDYTEGKKDNLKRARRDYPEAFTNWTGCDFVFPSDSHIPDYLKPKGDILYQAKQLHFNHDQIQNLVTQIFNFYTPALEKNAQPLVHYYPTVERFQLTPATLRTTFI